MKKITLFGILFMVVIIAAALYTALRTGETSPLFASGTLTLADEIAADAKGIHTVFITVFDADSAMPMPYGAMRETINTDATGTFLEFFLTKERLQVMRPDLPAPQNLRLKARLDVDGQGGPDQPGDLTGSVDRVALGSQNVALRIDSKVP